VLSCIALQARKPIRKRCSPRVSPRLRVSASSSISRTPRDPDPDGTVAVSPCQGDCGRRLRAASEKRAAPIAGCGIPARYLAQSHQHKIFCNPLSHKYLSHLTRLSTNPFSRVPCHSGRGAYLSSSPRFGTLEDTRGPFLARFLSTNSAK